MKNLRKKVIEILTEVRPEFDFNEDINFIEAGMLDSFDIVNLVSTLDEAYGISIDGIDILPENFSSISNIISLLKNNGAK